MNRGVVEAGEDDSQDFFFCQIPHTELVRKGANLLAGRGVLPCALAHIEKILASQFESLLDYCQGLYQLPVWRELRLLFNALSTARGEGHWQPSQCCVASWLFDSGFIFCVSSSPRELDGVNCIVRERLLNSIRRGDCLVTYGTFAQEASRGRRFINERVGFVDGSELLHGEAQEIVRETLVFYQLKDVKEAVNELLKSGYRKVVGAEANAGGGAEANAGGGAEAEEGGGDAAFYECILRDTFVSDQLKEGKGAVNNRVQACDIEAVDAGVTLEEGLHCSPANSERLERDYPNCAGQADNRGNNRDSASLPEDEAGLLRGATGGDATRSPLIAENPEFLAVLWECFYEGSPPPVELRESSLAGRENVDAPADTLRGGLASQVNVAALDDNACMNRNVSRGGSPSSASGGGIGGSFL